MSNGMIKPEGGGRSFVVVGPQGGSRYGIKIQVIDWSLHISHCVLKGDLLYRGIMLIYLYVYD